MDSPTEFLGPSLSSSSGYPSQPLRTEQRTVCQFPAGEGNLDDLRLKEGEKKEDFVCPICMHEYDNDDHKWTTLPAGKKEGDCKHTFHIACLNTWFKACAASNGACPECKTVHGIDSLKSNGWEAEVEELPMSIHDPRIFEGLHPYARIRLQIQLELAEFMEVTQLRCEEARRQGAQSVRDEIERERQEYFAETGFYTEEDKEDWEFEEAQKRRAEELEKKVAEIEAEYAQKAAAQKAAAALEDDDSDDGDSEASDREFEEQLAKLRVESEQRLAEQQAEHAATLAAQEKAHAEMMARLNARNATMLQELQQNAEMNKRFARRG